MTFTVYDPSNAPEDARPLLQKAESAYGFVPNILGVMAESPALLEAYMSLSQIFDKTDFSATERQLVLLTVSHENNCGYCTKAHSAIAAMQDVPDSVVEAVAEGRPLEDSRLEALRQLTRRAVSTRGNLEASDIEAFHAAGYSTRHVLDVLTGVGMKTLSNYTNHIADTPLDVQFGG